MKITLSLTTKPQNEIFKASFFDVKEMKKSPGKSPRAPPTPPRNESHTPRKDETYRGSRRPSPKIRRQMARKKRTSQRIIFNKIREKGKQEADDPLVYVTKKHPNTYPRKIIQNALENHRYLNNPTKRSFIRMSRSRKMRITGNNFMQLVISIR
jgi:hypothetical protein